MFQTRASRAALASGLALLLGSAAVVIPGVAAAQVQQGGVIQRILVQGNERIEQSTKIGLLLPRPREHAVDVIGDGSQCIQHEGNEPKRP